MGFGIDLEDLIQAGKNIEDLDSGEKTITDENNKQLEAKNKIVTKNNKLNNSLDTTNTKTKDVTNSTNELKDKFKKIGEDIEKGIVTNLTDAVMGTKSLAEAATSVLNNLKRQLVELAIQRAVSGIGGKIGGFLGGLFTGKKERGGRVSAGGAFLVGERGPEILQMGSKGGNIIPNSAIGKGGGAVNNVVNVNESLPVPATTILPVGTVAVAPE